MCDVNPRDVLNDVVGGVEDAVQTIGDVSAELTLIPSIGRELNRPAEQAARRAQRERERARDEANRLRRNRDASSRAREEVFSLRRRQNELSALGGSTFGFGGQPSLLGSERLGG